MMRALPFASWLPWLLVIASAAGCSATGRPVPGVGGDCDLIGGSDCPNPRDERPALDNPSGDCVASGDGGRGGYHSPAGSRWLPDCQNPLEREYYRVFVTEPGVAYMIPRPDGAYGLLELCANAAEATAELLAKYGLCDDEQGSAAAVERINSLLPADALELARRFHEVLVFSVVGDQLTPFAPPTDIIDACALQQDRSAELAAICEREVERLASGNEIGFDYSGPGAVELAGLLNQLYGIDL